MFYVGGAMGGGGGSQFLRINISQIETENRAIAYALS